jgi:hypothetical protein
VFLFGARIDEADSRPLTFTNSCGKKDLENMYTIQKEILEQTDRFRPNQQMGIISESISGKRGLIAV